MSNDISEGTIWIIEKHLNDHVQIAEVAVTAEFVESVLSRLSIAQFILLVALDNPKAQSKLCQTVIDTANDTEGFTVWLDGGEVVDNYTNLANAIRVAHGFVENGYTDLTIEYIDEDERS